MYFLDVFRVFFMREDFKCLRVCIVVLGSVNRKSLRSGVWRRIRILYISVSV